MPIEVLPDEWDGSIGGLGPRAGVAIDSLVGVTMNMFADVMHGGVDMLDAGVIIAVGPMVPALEPGVLADVWAGLVMNVGVVMIGVVSDIGANSFTDVVMPETLEELLLFC